MTMERKATGEKRFAEKLLPYVLICMGVFLIVFVGWGIWKAAFPGLPPLRGQMESRVINVSSKVPGRVMEVLVEEGDFVEKGQPLVRLHLPEIEAKLAEAKAREKAALSAQSLVDEGARPQEKLVARAEWDRALADADLAKKTYARIVNLFGDGLVSRQRYDEARANMLATADRAKAAKQVYDIAVIGARRQERSEARDMSGAAAAVVDEAASMAAEKELASPHAGQVDKIILVEGEMAGAGFPILTLVDLADQWATFNIREEYMPGVEIGKRLKARVPAIGGEEVEYDIYYISPRADYATWRSTRENSGYDMKTFEVRARPVKRAQGLRPGMSVLVAR